MADIDILDKPAVAHRWDFVPVIFANGEDDDVPGLTAACTNKRVQYDGKIYEKGEEMLIYNEVLRLKCDCLHILGPGDVPTDAGPGDVVIWQQPDIDGTRWVTIDTCTGLMGK